MPAASAYFATVLAAASAVLAQSVDVASCADFAAVDRQTETEVTITTADLACDEYTRLSIRSAMTLKSTAGAVTVSNLGLKIYGSLTIEPDVVFTGISNVDSSGAALKVERGGVAVFQGTADFVDISVKPREDDVLLSRKGAAINSNGAITFEKDATFTGCFNDAQDEPFIVSSDTSGITTLAPRAGGGGAVYQLAKGTMHFMGSLTMSGNENHIDQVEGSRSEGGAFYNKGDVWVDGEAVFADNRGLDGGAIYQTRWGTFTFNSFATFQSNVAANNSGGGIFNFGGVFSFLAGASFDGNIASSNGEQGKGGGIYNYDGGDITLASPTSFTNNEAHRGGAFVNRNTDESFEERYGRAYKTPTITYPADTVFEGNQSFIDICPDIAFELDETCGL